MTTFNEVHLHHATRKKAEKLASLLEAEYPALALYVWPSETNFHGDLPKASGWYVKAGETTVLETEKVPELADVLEACEDAGVDPEEGAEEEADPQPSSVVPHKYRVQYALSSSTGVSCGDWLAEWLADTCLVDGKLDVEAFHKVCSNNGVDLGAKWAAALHDESRRSRGWQGRVRMNGRQQLEKVVALLDEFDNSPFRDAAGDEVEVPADFRKAMASRHSKYVAKQAKKYREAAAEQAEAE